MKLVSLLLLPVLAVAAAAAGDADAVRRVLRAYQAAMEARSVEALGKVVDPDLLVLEGTHKNAGWKDYRDNHIGPEMAEWKSFQVADPKIVSLEVEHGMAYAVQEATYTIALEGKTVSMAGAETFVLRKGRGGWRVKHVHFSAKKLAPAAAE